MMEKEKIGGQKHREIDEKGEEIRNGGKDKDEPRGKRRARVCTSGLGSNPVIYTKQAERGERRTKEKG